MGEEKSTILFPSKVQKLFLNASLSLSKNGKMVLDELIGDGNILIEDALKKASLNNPDFEEDLKIFILKRKKEIIKDMEKQERENESKLQLIV